MLREKYERKSNALPATIVVDKGTSAAVVRTLNQRGLARNWIGTIDDYCNDDTMEHLVFIPDVGKSKVLDENMRLKPLVAPRLNLARIVDDYVMGQFKLRRTQFPLKSLLAINSHIVQGQEITRPTVVSLARNSQNETQGVNYGNAYTQLSRFTSPDDSFLVHSMEIKDIHVHPSCKAVDEYHRHKIRSQVDYSFNRRGELIKGDTSSIVRVINDVDINAT